MVPLEPAALSVWQPPQPRWRRPARPTVVRRAAARRSRRALLSADQLRADEEHDDRERRDDPGHWREDAVDLGEHA